MNLPPPMLSIAQRKNPRIFCAEDGCGEQLPTGFSKSQRCPRCEQAGRIGLKRRYEFGLAGSVTAEGELETLRRTDRFSLEWLIVQVVALIAGAGDGIAVGMVSNAIWGAVVGVVIGLIGLYAPSGTTSVEERRWVT